MIYLVFPTSWHPSQPYLSLPSLKAFLNMHGVHDVVQRDLAIELLNDLCTWEKTKPLYERIIRELNELSSRPRLTQVEAEKFNKLREAEVELAAGKTVPLVARKLGISEQSYYRWRKQYGGLRTNQAKRLKELEQENSRLKRLVGELNLDKAILEEAVRGNY